MKKVLIAVASAIAMFASGSALTPTACQNCGGDVGEVSECETVVFKVTGSGKAVAIKNDYKSISKLKIVKGAIALTGTYCESTGICCYESGMFYATVKAGNRTIHVAQSIVPAVWSVFGKNLDAVRSADVKKGRTYSLDSALFIESEGDAYVDDADVADLSFAASSFGKVDVKIAKGTKAKSSSSCSPVVECAECEPSYIPKSYSGWFVGKYACVGEEDCFLCDCADTDVFGGTWKASYVKTAKTDYEARKLAGVSTVFDFSVE